MALMYEAQGNLMEAGKYVANINALTPSYEAVGAKLTQLRLERKSDEAVQLLKTRFAQFQFGSDVEEAVFGYFLALAQHVAGDNSGAQATAAQTRDRLVQLTTNQPDNDWLAVVLSGNVRHSGRQGRCMEGGRACKDNHVLTGRRGNRTLC